MFYFCNNNIIIIIMNINTTLCGVQCRTVTPTPHLGLQALVLSLRPGGCKVMRSGRPENCAKKSATLFERDSMVVFLPTDGTGEITIRCKKNYHSPICYCPNAHRIKITEANIKYKRHCLGKRFHR